MKSLKSPGHIQICLEILSSIPKNQSVIQAKCKNEGNHDF